MAKLNIWFTLTIITMWGPVLSVREYSKEDLLKLREEVREMFTFAYDSYLHHAYPADELRPLSCDGVDTWGSYSLTLVDALDTLVIMGNYTEFNRVVPLVLKKKKYDSDINVSVFETNIRIIGGLLSAHLLSYKTGIELEPGWPCNGPLLRLAEDVAQRLIAAFDTNTGMPYGTVNLRSGVPPGETSITCTAGVGTFIIEFGTLSRLTGDPLYEEVAYNALMALYNHRSDIGLLGNHVDVQTGRWTAQDAGIGGGVDSYFEYLVKGAILLEKPELMSMFIESRETIEHYLRKEDWYVWVSMLKGQVTQPIFQSLDAYWPAILSLIGESDTALRILHNYHSVWRQYGFTPEVYNLASGEAATSRESYPLRPELIESIMYVYRATRDPALLAMGEDILRSIQHSARTSCGYATIKDVRDHRKEDRMESFFLAETTKYLYLLFDTDNFVHNPGSAATVVRTPGGDCVADAGGYVFNTEAHPIDPALLQCCHARNRLNLTEVQRMYQILDEEENIKYSINKEPENDTAHQEYTPVSEILETDPTLAINGTVTYRDRNLDLITLDQSKPEVKDPDSELAIEKKVTYSDRNLDLITLDQSKTDIKTEIHTEYVNIDGSGRENPASDKDLNGNGTMLGASNTSDPTMQRVDIDRVTVFSGNLNSNLRTPWQKDRSKQILNMLPAVLQDFLSPDGGKTARCSPQRMLERLRRERRYPAHPHTRSYDMLLTPAPNFLQRISLAGEFFHREQQA